MIKVYLVGGAVRDALLGRPVTEHDYVVVGATPQQMLDFGFSQVGADFPVFLHPRTHDEYALARTERKSGKGYLGFEVYTDPKVTLEEDLIRRDLTINAMAIEVNGLFDSNFKENHFNSKNVIDPYGGLQDIEQKQLRHVSAAFAEDPVRVLRLARFASRYAPIGFTIADDTKQLVRQMIDKGELNHLVAERVWAETRKALSQAWSDIYFDSLAELGALSIVMPDLYQAIMHHEKWQITRTALRFAANIDSDEVIRFSLLSTAFLSQTPTIQHEDLASFNQFCTQLKIPKNLQQFGVFFLCYFYQFKNFDNLTAQEMFDLTLASNALKDEFRLQKALTCYHIYQFAQQKTLLQQMHSQLSSISIKDVDSSLTGKAIGEAINMLRYTKLKTIINNQRTL